MSAHVHRFDGPFYTCHCGVRAETYERAVRQAGGLVTDHAGRPVPMGTIQSVEIRMERA